MKSLFTICILLTAILIPYKESLCQPNAPSYFTAVLYNSATPNYIKFTVRFNYSGEHPIQGCLYQADTITTNLSKFTKIKTLILDSLSNDSTNLSFNFNNFSPGCYTFYMTAKDSSGESPRSEFRNITVPVSDSNRVNFTTSPPTTGMTGSLYQYNAHAASTDGRTVNYSMDSITPPTGMNLASSTGVITWTPSASGDYHISLKAFIVAEPAKYARQDWTIHVGDSSGTHDSIYIETSPIDSMIIGSEYSYHIIISSKLLGKNIIGHCTVHLSISDSTMAQPSIDSAGIIRWAPKKTGNFNFHFTASLISDPKVYVSQDWTLHVMPSKPGHDSLNFTVTYPDTAYTGHFYKFNVSMVVDILIQKQVSLDSIKITAEYTPSDTATVEGMDVELFDRVITVHPKWPVGKFKFHLELSQKSDTTIKGIGEWWVTVLDSNKSPVNTHFSGYVKSRKQGIPIPNTLVEFKQYKDSLYIKTFSTTTNDSGNYSIDVPKLFGYKLKATPPKGSKYKIQYYNGKGGAPDEIGCVIVLSSEDDDWVYAYFDLNGPSDSVLMHGTVMSSVDKYAVCVDAIITASAYRNDSLLKNYTTKTGQDGSYQMNIPKGYGYMFKAEPKKDSSGKSKYTAMYYDGLSGTSDIRGGVVVAITSEDDAEEIKVNFDPDVIPNNNNGLYGSVVDIDNNLVPSLITLYSLKSDTSGKKYIIKGQTTEQKPGDTGFVFTNLNPGKYIIFVSKGNNTFDFYKWGYYIQGHPAVIGWEDAISQSVIGQVDVSMDVIQGPVKVILDTIMGVSGQGSVNGNIQKDSMKAYKGYDSPLANNTITSVYLYAIDKDGKIRKVSSTNSYGSYELKGLAFEQYNIIADRIGFKQYKFIAEPKPSQPAVTQDIIMIQGTISSVDVLIPVDATEIKLYPNPATEILNVRFKNNYKQMDITLINSTGIVFYKSRLTSEENLDGIKIDTRTLANGMYYLLINDGEKLNRLSFVVIK